jgi:maltose-binding protein MalE
MRRKLLVPIVIATIALVAAACTSDSSTSSVSSGSSSGAPIELTMWHGYGEVIDNQ